MAQGQKRNKALVPEARAALYQFKYETANELGIQVPQDDYWGTLSSRDCGAVGGNMVKKMIQQAQQQLAQRTPMQ